MAKLPDFEGLAIFAKVLQMQSFARAATELQMSKATVSKAITRLETKFGTRLFNRTSRRFAMTDAGEEFYRHAVVMLRESELAETAIRHRLTEPTGIVRCTAAMATMQFALREVVADFLARHPKVDVVAHATDQNVDIVGENYDVAIGGFGDGPVWIG